MSDAGVHASPEKDRTMAAVEAVRAQLGQFKEASTGLRKFGKGSGGSMKRGVGASTIGRRGAGNMMELLTEEVEALHGELLQREEDLRMAADIGETLADKLEEYVERNAGLEEKLASADDRAEAAIKEKTALERRDRHTKIMIQELESQVEEHVAEAKKLEQQLARERSEATRNASGANVDKLEAANAELQELRAKLSHQKSESARLKKSLDQDREQLRDTTDDLKRAEARLEELSAIEEEAKGLRRKAAEFDEMAQERDALQFDNETLMSSVRNLSADREQYRAALEEGEALITQLQAENEELRQALGAAGGSFSSLASEISPERVSDFHSRIPQGSGLPSGGSGMSLADELVDDDDSEDEEMMSGEEESRAAKERMSAEMLGDTERGTNKAARVAGDGANADDDEDGELGGSGEHKGEGADSESGRLAARKRRKKKERALRDRQAVIDEDEKRKNFFFLTVLSAKLNASDMMEYISSVNPQRMYVKALKEGVPLHKYHSWIEKELTHAYIEAMYAPTASAVGGGGSADAPLSGAALRRETLRQQQEQAAKDGKPAPPPGRPKKRGKLFRFKRVLRKVKNRLAGSETRPIGKPGSSAGSAAAAAAAGGGAAGDGSGESGVDSPGRNRSATARDDLQAQKQRGAQLALGGANYKARRVQPRVRRSVASSMSASSSASSVSAAASPIKEEEQPAEGAE